MRLERLRLELRMKLAPDEMRMIGQLDHLDVSPVRRRTRDFHTGGCHRLLILAIEFVTMAVPLANFGLAVNSEGESVRFNLARPGAKPHRPAEFLYSAQFAQLVDHAMRRRRIELARIRIRQSHHVACKLDARG